MQSRTYRRQTRKVLSISATQPQLVLAAMNIVAEHEAGGDVAPGRLKGARDYLALWERVRATSAPPACALPKEAA